MRHKLEKQKKRKLTSEEKKFFKEKSSDYIFSLFSDEDNRDLNSHTTHTDSRSQVCDTSSSQDLDLYLEDTSPTQQDRTSTETIQTKHKSKCAPVISTYLSGIAKTPTSRNRKQDVKKTVQDKPNSTENIQKYPKRVVEKNMSCEIVTDENSSNNIQSPDIRTPPYDGMTCLGQLKSSKKNSITDRTDKTLCAIQSPRTPKAAKPVSPMGCPGWLSARKPQKGVKRGAICLSDDDLCSSESPPSKQGRNGDAVNASPGYGCFSLELDEDKDCSLSPIATGRRGQGRSRGNKTPTRGGSGRARSRGRNTNM